MKKAKPHPCLTLTSNFLTIQLTSSIGARVQGKSFKHWSVGEGGGKALLTVIAL